MDAAFGDLSHSPRTMEAAEDFLTTPKLTNDPRLAIPLGLLTHKRSTFVEKRFDRALMVHLHKVDYWHARSAVEAVNQENNIVRQW